MVRRRTKHLPFRIFYSTTYTSLWFVVLVVLAITPASLIYTAIEAAAYQYVFITGGVYVLTVAFAIFIYSSRLYTNRTVLAAVGKSWIPVEEGEVGRNVRKIIAQALERSAMIAWEGRPRDLAKESAHKDDEDVFAEEKDTLMAAKGGGEVVHLVGRVIKVNPSSPPWGHVEHAGWSSPSKLDTATAPHVYYVTVTRELPNLVEARAVSLAPLALEQNPMDPETGTLVDAQTVAALQRPPPAGLREYLGYLDSLDLITIPDNGDDFLALYEEARFSPDPLTETKFQLLMAAFADLLSGMNKLPRQANGKLLGGLNEKVASKAASIAASEISVTSISSNESAIRHRSAASRLPSIYAIALQEPLRSPTPMGRSQTSTRMSSRLHRQSSMVSARRPDQVSLRSTRSGSSSSLQSAQSVIRLTPSPGPDQLPYE